MIVIRKATLEDASAIANVHVVAWKETYRGIVADDVLDNLSIQRRTEQWVNSLSDDTHAYHKAFVAVVDGRVMGFSNFGAPQIKDSDFDGELFAIYILKAAHNMGVGRMLVKAVVNGLREMGNGSMIVWVLKENPARGFYERLGGEYLFEKPIQIGADQLMEVAYGWRDLSIFSG